MPIDQNVSKELKEKIKAFDRIQKDLIQKKVLNWPVYRVYPACGSLTVECYSNINKGKDLKKGKKVGRILSSLGNKTEREATNFIERKTRILLLLEKNAE